MRDGYSVTQISAQISSDHRPMMARLGWPVGGRGPRWSFGGATSWTSRVEAVAAMRIRATNDYGKILLGRGSDRRHAQRRGATRAARASGVDDEEAISLEATICS